MALCNNHHPEQVPLLNGEFEYLARLTAEVCE